MKLKWCTDTVIKSNTINIKTMFLHSSLIVGFINIIYTLFYYVPCTEQNAQIAYVQGRSHSITTYHY